jgi:hypothetical protein
MKVWSRTKSNHTLPVVGGDERVAVTAQKQMQILKVAPSQSTDTAVRFRHSYTVHKISYKIRVQRKYFEAFASFRLTL